MLADGYNSDIGVMSDIFWFFAVFFVCLGVFAAAHVVCLRRHRPVRLMLYLMGIYVVSACFSSLLCYWVFADQFSSPGTYAVANTGAVVAACFAGFLYIFLGPATADRSLTAHLLVYLYRSANGPCSEKDILEAYSPRVFLEKRYRECRRAGLLERSDGMLTLSVKGKCVAAMYDRLLRVLALEKREEFYFSFPGRKSTAR